MYEHVINGLLRLLNKEENNHILHNMQKSCIK